VLVVFNRALTRSLGRQRRALANLGAVLKEAGSGFDSVVKTNIFLTTMDDFAAMNEAWDEFFTQDVKPVRKNEARKATPSK
jgi:enamine deaminase RidA (YjgF/YER057c/UK114 family)